MKTHVGLGEIWVKTKEDDVRTGLARSEPFLVEASAALLVAVVLPVAALLPTALTAVVARVVVALRRVVPLTRPSSINR